MSVLRQSLPWWLRIGAKIVLSRLPVSYSIWKSLHLFEHGDMNKPVRAIDNFLAHARSADVLDNSSSLPRFSCDGDYNVLELGPGDSLFSTIIAKALGASHTWLVDAGEYATKNIYSYMDLIRILENGWMIPPCKEDIETLGDVLRIFNGTYLTDGVRSLKEIPAFSIDYCFSNAVLEHVPKGDFVRLACELYRIMKPDGVAFHRIDLKDHLGGGLNNLRFSESTWESKFFTSSGFYTNRIRFNDIQRIFMKAGFHSRVARTVRWKILPIKRSMLDVNFQNLPDDDLLVSGFDLVLLRKSDL
jgi:SAM-dependent methyltransferase